MRRVKVASLLLAAILALAGGLRVYAQNAQVSAGGALLPYDNYTLGGSWRWLNKPFGYATGTGATVTQLTNRATGVTLNNLSGAITTNTASLAAEATAVFVVTNSFVEIGDVVVVSQRSGANSGNTDVYVSAVAAGSFSITVADNNTLAGTAETGAIIINFAIIKAVSS